MPNAESCLYVYVNEDGTARELHPNERQYLETEFLPGDGAAPHVKRSYTERNGWVKSGASSRDRNSPRERPYGMRLSRIQAGV
jgi:hypothetical protein